MEGINQFIIDGNVVRDVELRHTARGTPTCTYVVAVDRVRFEGEQRVQETDYIPVTTYGRQAEADARFLRKGAGVTVTGSISSWYRADLAKGGFNFEAERVIYRGKPAAGKPTAGEAAHSLAGEAHEDDWLRDYEQQARLGSPSER